MIPAKRPRTKRILLDLRVSSRQSRKIVRDVLQEDNTEIGANKYTCDYFFLMASEALQ